MDTVNCTINKRHPAHDFDNGPGFRAHCPGITAAQAREIRGDYYSHLCSCGDQDCPCDGGKVGGVGKAPTHTLPSTSNAHDAYTDDPWAS